MNECPDNTMLAEYLDGRLDAMQRASVEDHISRCDDCYFSVRESTLVWAEPGVDGSSLGGVDALDGASAGGGVADASGGLVGAASPAETPGAPRPRRSAPFRYLLPLAATLVVAAFSIAIWRQARPADSYADVVAPLVNAVGERRFFEPRLVGGFKFGPRLAAKRSSGSASDSEAWAVLAVAEEMRSGPESSSSPASSGTRAGRAAAALFLDKADEAVAEFLNLLAEEPDNAEWASNLAAALLVRATNAPETEARDNTEALKYAERACRLNPALVEACFNHGIALETLGKAVDARAVFTQLAARGDSWSAAAREQLDNLRAGTVGPKP
jgi:hypothetical protein